jgi:hypothetical protein
MFTTMNISKLSNLWSNNWILHNVNAPFQRALSANLFLVKKKKNNNNNNNKINISVGTSTVLT